MTQRRSCPLGFKILIPAMMLLMEFVLLTNAAPLQDITEIQQYTEGCYYNYNHYNEGDRILTNEPCLNCTCHNKMLMCYLRVCPFTKPIGHDCVVEKREDQCCPIITCPEVPVDVAHHIPEPGTELSIPKKYGCSIEDRFYPEGAQVPSNPNKPCELCYCIKNRTSCLMQECTLHIDGCQPIYNKGSCCPVRYNCDHENDILNLADDSITSTTTLRPTQGFILTTSVTPTVSTDCMHNNNVYPDGAFIRGKNSCEHCYCMRGDIVCAVQECEMPMLDGNGDFCHPLPPIEGECCPRNYACEGNEATTKDTLNDVSTISYTEEEGKVTKSSPTKDLHSSISIEDLQLQKHIDDDLQQYTQANKIDHRRPISQDKIDIDTQGSTLSPVLSDNDEILTASVNSVTEKNNVENNLDLMTTLKIPIPITTDKNMQTTPEYSDNKTFPENEEEEDKYPSATNTHTTFGTSTEKYGEEMIQSENKAETAEGDQVDHTTENLSHVDDKTFDTEFTTQKSESFYNNRNVIKTHQDRKNVSASEKEYSSTTAEQAFGIKGTLEKTLKTELFERKPLLSDIPLKPNKTTDFFKVSEKDNTEMAKKDTQTTTVQSDIYINMDEIPEDVGSLSDIIDVLTNTAPLVVGDKIQAIYSEEDINTTAKTPNPTLMSEGEKDILIITLSSKTAENELEHSAPAGEPTQHPEHQLTTSSMDINKIEDKTEENTITDIRHKLQSQTDNYPPTFTTSLTEKYESTTEDITTGSADNYLSTEYPLRTTGHLSSSTTTTDKNTEQSTIVSILPDEMTPANAYGMETIPSAIPGEGYCLVGQKTYQHNSLVPLSNKCDSYCRCLSSVVVCEPVQCDLPNNIEICSLDILARKECCPKYNCETESASENITRVEEEDKTVNDNHSQTYTDNVSSLNINKPMSHIKYKDADVDSQKNTYAPQSDTSISTSQQQVEDNLESLGTLFNDTNSDATIHLVNKFDKTKKGDLATNLTESPIETQYSSFNESSDSPVQEESGFYIPTPPSDIETLDSTQDSNTREPEGSNEENTDLGTEGDNNAIREPFNTDDQTIEQTHDSTTITYMTSTTTNDEISLTTDYLPVDGQFSVEREVTTIHPADETQTTIDETLYQSITPIIDETFSSILHVTPKVPTNQDKNKIFDEHLQKSKFSSDDKEFLKPTTVGDYPTIIENNAILKSIPKGTEAEKVTMSAGSMTVATPLVEDTETVQSMSTTETNDSKHVQKIPAQTGFPIVSNEVDKQTETSSTPQQVQSMSTSIEIVTSGLAQTSSSSDGYGIEEFESENTENAKETAFIEGSNATTNIKDASDQASTEKTYTSESTEGADESPLIEEVNASKPTEGFNVPVSTDSTIGSDSTELANVTSSTESDIVSNIKEETYVPVSSEGADMSVITHGTDEILKTEEANVLTHTETAVTAELTETADTPESTASETEPPTTENQAISNSSTPKIMPESISLSQFQSHDEYIRNTGDEATKRDGSSPQSSTYDFDVKAPKQENVTIPFLLNDLPATLNQDKELQSPVVDIETQTVVTSTEDIPESEKNDIFHITTEPNSDSEIITSAIESTIRPVESLDDTTEYYTSSSEDHNKFGLSSLPTTDFRVEVGEDAYVSISSILSSAAINKSPSDNFFDVKTTARDEVNNQLDESTSLPDKTIDGYDKKLTASTVTAISASGDELSDFKPVQAVVSSQLSFDKNDIDSYSLSFKNNKTKTSSLADSTNVENKTKITNLDNKDKKIIDIMSKESDPLQEEVVVTSISTSMFTEALPSSTSIIEGEKDTKNDLSSHSLLNENVDVDNIDKYALYHTTKPADISEEQNSENSNLSENSTQYSTTSPLLDINTLQTTSPGEKHVFTQATYGVSDPSIPPINEGSFKQELFVQKETTLDLMESTTTSTTLFDRKHEQEDTLHMDKISTDSWPLLTESTENMKFSLADHDTDIQIDVDDTVFNTDKFLVKDILPLSTEKESTLVHIVSPSKEVTSLEASHKVVTDNNIFNEENRKTNTIIAFDGSKVQKISEVDSVSISSTAKPFDIISETTELSTVENMSTTIPVSVGKEEMDNTLGETVPSTAQNKEHMSFTNAGQLLSREHETPSATKDESVFISEHKTQYYVDSITVSPSVIESLDSVEETDGSFESEEEITSIPSALENQNVEHSVTEHLDDTLTEVLPNKVNEVNHEQETNKKQTTVDEKDEDVPSTTSHNSYIKTTSLPFVPSKLDDDMILESIDKPTEYPTYQGNAETMQMLTYMPSPESLQKPLDTITVTQEKNYYAQIPVETTPLDLESDVEENNSESSSSMIYAAESLELSKGSETEYGNVTDNLAIISTGADRATSRPDKHSYIAAHTSTDANKSTEIATETAYQTKTTSTSTTTTATLINQDPFSTTVSSMQYAQSPTSYGEHPHQYPSYPEDEYTDEEETEVFGPGTCRYGGKLFVSAQQIPRDDPCDFCFCFRSDIICLQQSCPPPISGCHEEPISGFCCPRYECPVSMSTVLNITTSTTTTSTTLPPHFLHHAYGDAAQKNGCHINGKSYRVGEKIYETSGPCIHCTCGGDGQMKCDPKTCSPEPILQQMIAVVATRRR